MGYMFAFGSIFIALLCCEATYDGYQVFNLWPKTKESKQAFLDFGKRFQDEYDVWSVHRDLESPVSILVSPSGLTEFQKLLAEFNVSYTISIPDVMMIINEQKENSNWRRHLKMYRTLWQSEHDFYRTVDEINIAIDRYSRKFPFIQKEIIGTTSEGRSIWLLKVAKDPKKPIIWIDAGIHAREWIAPAATLYVIDKLLTRDGQALLKNHQFYFVPLVNPDGYEYTHTTARLWRKNRSPSPGESCVGVDLNRNFPLKWGIGEGTSSHACDDTYRGIEPASELESKALIRRLTELKEQLVLYLNLHSYGQYILTPYGFTRYKYPKNYRNMLKLGNIVRNKIQRRHHYVYRVGSASDLLYEASGGIEDYVSGILNVSYSYTIELCDEGRYGFLLPASFIRTVGEQLWTAVKVFAYYL